MKINVELIHSHEIKEKDAERYVSIWNEEFPITIPKLSIKSFIEKISKQDIKLLFAKNIEGELLGAMELQFYKNHSAWFIMLVDKKYQKKGIGSLLINHAKQITNELHGWIVPPGKCLFKRGYSLYKSPFLFYKKHGFKTGKIKNTSKGTYLEIVWKKESD